MSEVITAAWRARRDCGKTEGGGGGGGRSKARLQRQSFAYVQEAGTENIWRRKWRRWLHRFAQAAGDGAHCHCRRGQVAKREVVKVRRRRGKGSSTAAGCAAPEGRSTYFGKV